LAVRIGARLIALALSLSGCSLLEPGPDACRPVDEGGECFTPSRDGFLTHALASARAWPQLDGVGVEATEVIDAVDAESGRAIWIVPIRAGGQVVAASRFQPFADTGQVRLGEVTLYQPARASFPIPRADQRLVIFIESCGDPLPESCLFTNFAWRLQAAP
jgi:hypothetical protein